MQGSLFMAFSNISKLNVALTIGDLPYATTAAAAAAALICGDILCKLA